MGRVPNDERRRLTRAADFDASYRRGRSRASRHLVVYAFAREPRDGDPIRLGVAVSRKVGGAVQRNRLKRQLREAMARLAGQAPRGSDVVIVARPGLSDAVESGGLEWLVEELRPLVAQPERGEP